MQKFVAGLVMVVGLLALVAVGCVWGGFVLSTLWNWFAPPFTAVRLSLASAVGLACLISCLKGMRYRKNDGGTESLVYGFTAPALLLLVGWIAHHYA